MTAGAHYYFLREDRIIAEQQSKLRQINERNARLQQELVMLNASIGSIVQGLDKVSHSVGSAAKHVVAPSASLPGGADASALGAVLATLREENEHLKKALSALPATAPASATAAGAAGGAPLGRRWLTIGIPTVPRKGDLRYLEPTLQAITDQLPLDAGDPLFGEVLVVVLNNKPGTHAVFDELRTKIMAGPHALYFKFVEQEIQQTDNVHNPEHSANVPSSNVRRQTRAVISTLRASAGQGRYFLFMEDDFVVCPHALRAMSYITNKANAYYPRGWSGIRVSHGLCGILINDADVPEVANYLEQHQARRPPDHLLPEWIHAEREQAAAYLQGRTNAGYRFNVIEHIGHVSTLRGARQDGWPGCWEELVFPIVFEGEAWNPKQCAADDLWPCEPRPATWPHDWPLWHARHKEGPAGAERVTLMGPREK